MVQTPGSITHLLMIQLFFVVDPVDDGSAEDVSVSALVIFDDGPVSVVKNSAVDELSTVKAENSIVVYISDNDVSVAVVSESDIFVDVPVSAVRISVVFEDGSDSAVSVVDVDNSVADGSVDVVVRSGENNSFVGGGISVLFAKVSSLAVSISIIIVFEDGSDSVVDKSAVSGSLVVVIVDSVDEDSGVVYISDDTVSVPVWCISVVFEDGSDSAVGDSFDDDSVVFDVDPVDDESVEDVLVSALNCSVVFDDGPVSVVLDSAADELSTVKTKSSIVVYISNNDVSVVVVGESDISADVSVSVKSISVVFGDGPVPAVDNLVVGCSIVVVFDSVGRRFGCCVWIR